MAWENSKVEHQRLQLVMAYMKGQNTMTDLCKKHGVSRKTGYKWFNIFVKEGKEGLKDMPKAPYESYRIYNEEQIDMAIALKLKHRTWGPRKILYKLKEIYPKINWPSATRLYEIFKEHHLVTSRRVRHRVPKTCPLGDLQECNDIWAMDLKGWFLTGDRKKCEPLTLTDCHSRFLIKCTHLEKHTVDHVWPILEEAFLEFGLPLRIRSDNGPPFGSVGAGRLTRLSVNIIKAGVIPEWIEPGHPEQNGRHERMHLTLKQDAASPPKQTLSSQVKAIAEFKEEYNFSRPHEGLGMKTPGSCYVKSLRSWNGKLKSPEYDTNIEKRKIGPNGCLWYKQKEYYIGQALGGEHVGLKRNDEDQLEAYYGAIYLGTIDFDEGFKKPKRETRK